MHRRIAAETRSLSSHTTCSPTPAAVAKWSKHATSSHATVTVTVWPWPLTS